jgi:hypothetical protein
MSFEEIVSVAVGVLYLALAVVIVVQLRRAELRPPLPLVVLGVARLVPPFGDEPEGLSLLLDIALLAVLVIFLGSVQRIVTSFVYEREAMQRAQLDYDEALAHHESNVAAAQRDALAALDGPEVRAGD